MQEVLSVSNDVAAELATVGDGVLDALRDRLRITILLRGNRLTIEGDDPNVVQARAVVDELAVLEEFMPEPLTEDELEEIVDDAIAEVGATNMRDIGRVMADVMPQVAGRADGSAVSQLVREKLA